MGGGYAGLGYAVAVAVAGFVVVAFIGAHRGGTRGPRGVMKRLARPGARYTVRVGFAESTGGTWNPAKAMTINNFIHEYGTGTYWLDADGIVHLDWTPEGRPTVHLSGPSPQLRRRTSISAMVGVLSVVAGGAAVTFFVASGSAETRLSIAMLVGGIVLLLLWVVMLSGMVGGAVRRKLRRDT